MDIRFGALSPKLSEQIKGLPEVFDKDAEYITWLHFRGLLTDLETKNARKRLVSMVNIWVNRIIEAVTEIEKEFILMKEKLDIEEYIKEEIYVKLLKQFQNDDDEE